MQIRRWSALAIVALVGVAGCEAGTDDAELETEQETAERAPEPATEVSTPGAAGSMTLTQWDQDRGRVERGRELVRR